MTVTTEMRCPVDSQRMFGKIMSDGPPVISSNLLEFACDKCRRRMNVQGRVLHRFDLAGGFVETELVAR